MKYRGADGKLGRGMSSMRSSRIATALGLTLLGLALLGCNECTYHGWNKRGYVSCVTEREVKRAGSAFSLDMNSALLIAPESKRESRKPMSMEKDVIEKKANGDQCQLWLLERSLLAATPCAQLGLDHET